MSSLGTVVPEGPWCVFYATRRTVYWGLTHNVDFNWYSDLIWQTHQHTQRSQGRVDWHTHINVYLHHLLCAQSSYIYDIFYWMIKKNDFFLKISKGWGPIMLYLFQVKKVTFKNCCYAFCKQIILASSDSMLLIFSQGSTSITLILFLKKINFS